MTSEIRHQGGTRPDGRTRDIRYERSSMVLVDPDILSSEPVLKTDFGGLKTFVRGDGSTASLKPNDILHLRPFTFSPLTAESANMKPSEEGTILPFVPDLSTLDIDQIKKIAPSEAFRTPSFTKSLYEEGPDAKVALSKDGGMAPAQWITFARDAIGAEGDGPEANRAKKRLDKQVEAFGFPRTPTAEDGKRWVDLFTASTAFGLGDQIHAEMPSQKDDRDRIDFTQDLSSDAVSKWAQNHGLQLPDFANDAKMELNIVSIPSHESETGKKPTFRSLELAIDSTNHSTTYRLEIAHAKRNPEIEITTRGKDGQKPQAIRRNAEYEEVVAFKELFEDSVPDTIRTSSIYSLVRAALDHPFGDENNSVTPAEQAQIAALEVQFAQPAAVLDTNSKMRKDAAVNMSDLAQQYMSDPSTDAPFKIIVKGLVSGYKKLQAAIAESKKQIEETNRVKREEANALFKQQLKSQALGQGLDEEIAA